MVQASGARGSGREAEKLKAGAIAVRRALKAFDSMGVSFTDKHSSMVQRSSRSSGLRPYLRRKFLIYAGVPLALLFVALAVYRYHPPASITVFTFEGYLTPEIKAWFLREHHVRIIERNYASNQEMIAHLKVGWGEYDVVTPSNYVIEDLRRRNLVRRLDRKNLPNARHLDPLLEKYFPDSYLRYAVPYLWTTLSIGYREGAVRTLPTSWEEFFAKPNGGLSPAVVLQEKRETMGVALLSLGFEPGTDKLGELAELRLRLLDFKDRGVVFSTSPIDEVLKGNADLCLDWTSNILRGMAQDPQIRNIIPGGPTLLILDNLAIPTTSRHPELAEKFINFMLRPDVAAELGRNSYFLTSIPASYEMVSGGLRDTITRSFEAGELVPLTGFAGNNERNYDVIWAEFGVHHDD